MDEQSSNQESGGDPGWQRVCYVTRGYFGSIILCACALGFLAVVLAVLEAWNWTPPSPFDHIYNDKMPAPPKPTLILALVGVFQYMFAGALLGAVGGIGVVFLRSAKEKFRPLKRPVPR